MSWCESSRDDANSGPTEQNAPWAMLGNAEGMLNAEITKCAGKGSGQVVEVGSSVANIQRGGIPDLDPVPVHSDHECSAKRQY